jgi:serine/threonine protein kinase/tetratricopeptide (TPR) repeat protein
VHPETIDGYTVAGVLGDGSRGTVYHVTHPQSGQALALKLLSTAPLASVEQERLARQFKAVAAIDHPGVARLFDHGTFEDRPWYTMEQVDGVPLRAWMAEDHDLGELAQISDQVLQALACLHEHRTVHGDLKPEHILVTAGPHARLVDFGLARVVPISHARTPYTAPEVLQGQTPDIRGDLYAFGAILYECLTGQPPEMPLQLTGISEGIEKVLLRLLRNDPQGRYGSVREVQQALILAGFPAHGVVSNTALPAELVEPRLVGRSAQFDTLLGSLAAVRGGGVRVVVLHGEAGIGKSRLVSEFARQANLAGLPTWWSRCQPHEGMPFRALTPWLRPSDDLVTGPAGPESIIDLFGEQLPHNPGDRFRLYERAARQIRQTLQASPALLIVEDLHHADCGSIHMLEYLLANLNQACPAGGALIVVTVREEEVSRNQATLAWLKTAAVCDWFVDMPIGGLSIDDVDALIGSMLGGDPVPGGLSESLYRQTEGNPLFTCELLKALATQGTLTRASDRWVWQESRLPQTLEEALRVRLKRLPLSHREVLSHAAALGDGFSLPPLAASTTLSPAEVAEALESLLSQRILIEAPAGRFSCAHARIRELHLAGLSPHRVQDIHLKIGVALEAWEKEHPSPTGPFTLAWHFAQSGILYRAKPYLLAAADQCNKAFSWLDAAEFYRQLLEVKGNERLVAHEELCMAEESRADAMEAGGQREEAMLIVHRLLEHVPPGRHRPVHISRLRRKLACICYGIGDHLGAIEHLQEGLMALEISVPKEGVGNVLRTMENLVRSKSSALADKSLSDDPLRAEETLSLCEAVAHTVYVAGVAGSEKHHSMLVNTLLVYKQVASQTKAVPQQAMAEFLDAWYHATDNPPRPRQAHGSMQKLLELLNNMRDEPRKATLLWECGYLCLLLGWLKEALTYVSEGRLLADRLSDVTGVAWASITESHVLWLQGETEPARTRCQQAIHLSALTGMRGARAVAQMLLARQLMTAGELKEPARLLEEVRSGGTQGFENLMSDVGFGMLRRREGRHAEAVALLRQAMDGLLEGRRGTTHALEAGIELGATYYAQATEGRKNPIAATELEKLLKRLDPLSKELPLRRGGLLRLQGLLADLQGKSAESMTAFQESQKLLDAGGQALYATLGTPVQA